MVYNSSTSEKVFVSWSGGKDSYLSLLLAREKGLNIACLLSFVGTDGSSRSHGLDTEILKRQADLLGITLETETVTWESYEKGFEKAVKRLKRERSITGGVFGDINLVEHRQWIEKISERCGINYNLPLWLMEERSVSEELIRRGGKAMLVAIRSDLVDEKWLGKLIDQSFIDYCIKCGISPCGEGGEAHSLVIDGPLFRESLKYVTGEVERKENQARLKVLGV